MAMGVRSQVSRKLRVLHVISDSGLGGAGRYLLALLDGFRTVAAGHGQLNLGVMCPQGVLRAHLKDRQIEIGTLPVGDVSFHPGNLGAIYRYLGKAEPTLVHTHASLAGRVAARLRGRPRVVFTRHRLGDGTTQHPWNSFGTSPMDRSSDGPGSNRARLSKAPLFKKTIRGWGERLLADGVIAVSASVKNDLMSEGIPPEMIHVIPNGVRVPDPPLEPDNRSFRRALVDTAGWQEDCFILAVVGRLVPEKGHTVLLEAVRAALSEAPRLRLLVVGDGPERGQLEALAHRLEISQIVHFTGFRADVEKILWAVDAAALPSLSEGMPLALLEAMAVGKPVIASMVGGIPEAVTHEETGLLVLPGNHREFSRAIVRLYQDGSLARKLGISARQRIRLAFTVERMARETLSFYYKVMGICSGHSP